MAGEAGIDISNLSVFCSSNFPVSECLIENVVSFTSITASCYSYLHSRFHYKSIRNTSVVHIYNWIFF